jgi:hypothetical protein
MARWRLALCLVAAVTAAGCASAPKYAVSFEPAAELPRDGLPARAAPAEPSTESPAALQAAGHVALGTLRVIAERNATPLLPEAAARYGADRLTLEQDNRPTTLDRAQCVQVVRETEPSVCLHWDMETGVCNHWREAGAFECGQWGTRATRLVESRARLWRREPLAAALLRDRGAVETALREGADPNAAWSPLRQAILHPRPGIVEALLAGGAKADAAALGLAARSGNLEALRALLAHKAPVNTRYFRPGAFGQGYTTPLHDAVDGGPVEAVRLLLASGADVNAIPSFGSTALRLAVAAGRVEIVRVLLEAGADAGRKGLDGVSARDEAAAIASKTGDAGIAELLNSARGTH